MNELWKSPKNVNFKNAPMLEIPEIGDIDFGYHTSGTCKDVPDMMQQLDIKGNRTF